MKESCFGNIFSLQSNPIIFLPSLAKTGGNLSSKNKQPQTNLSSLKTYFVYTFFYSTIIDMCNLLKDHHSQGSSTANFEAFDLYMMMMLMEYDHTYENYH